MLGALESQTAPAAAKRLRLISKAETSRVATLLKSFLGHHSLWGRAKGGSQGPGDGLCHAGGRPGLNTGFWTRLPHPSVGGVRGWSWEAGSEHRWAAQAAVWGTEHICPG